MDFVFFMIKTSKLLIWNGW